MSLKINGAEALIAGLKKGADLTDVGNVVKQAGSTMQREAMRDVPVDTGTLKRSIKMTLHDNDMEVRVKAHMDYAAYVEFGTRFQSAKPFLRPTFNRQKKFFIQELNELMK